MLNIQNITRQRQKKRIALLMHKGYVRAIQGLWCVCFVWAFHCCFTICILQSEWKSVCVCVCVWERESKSKQSFTDYLIKSRPVRWLTLSRLNFLERMSHARVPKLTRSFFKVLILIISILVSYILNKPACLFCQQAHHPAAQDWLPTEAKQGWAWSVSGWETWEKLGCSWKRC